MDLIASIGLSAFLSAGAKGGAIGLGVGIFLVVILGKAGLFRRANVIHNAFVKLYYPYIPLVLAALCAAWLGLSAAQAEAVSLFSSLRPSVTKLSVDVAETVATGMAERAGETRFSAMTADFTGRIDKQLFAGLEQASSFVHDAVEPLRSAISAALAKALEDNLASLMSDRLGISGAERLWTQGVIAALQGGLLMDIVETQIGRRFEGVFGSIRTTALFLLLPVALETLLFRPRRKRAKT